MVTAAVIALSEHRSDHEADRRSPEYRLRQFFDHGTLRWLHAPDGSGVQAADGTVLGTRTAAFCTDPATQGGAMGSAGCGHIVQAIETALAGGFPVVGIWHSGGARLAEGVAALEAVGLVFEAMIRASGRIPQLSVVLGPAAGGAAYGPALTDIVIMASTARMFITGPDVVASVTGEHVSAESLGGSAVHGRKSGLAHVVADDEADAFARTRALIDLVGRPGTVDAAQVGDRPRLRSILPDRPQRAYDVRPIVAELLDGPGEELHRDWAPNIMTVLGRLGGRTVGIVANNPLRLGGCLNSLAAEKAARFVRTCDCFGIPLVVLVDVPGYLPGVRQEWEGMIRRGAKLLYAFAEAEVPRFTVVMRKSYGGAYIAMNSRSLGATRCFAWPGAEVAVMGASAAVRILHRRRLAEAPEDERAAMFDLLVAEQERNAGGVERAVAMGAIDEVIDPAVTRRRLAEALDRTGNPRGTHGNIPI
jgi:acetyl-CoA/propionyl-CoA carboxylase carboxyl transferase subunit